VCHAFLDFFRLRGGAEVFGFPISEIKVENGETVQYFQRFRLDWISGSGSQGEVQIGPLGRIHLENTDSVTRETQTPLPIVGDILPSVSLKYGVMQPSGEQIVYLHVIDEAQGAIAGVSATLNVNFGEIERTFIFPLTDSEGLSQVRVPFENVPSGTTINLSISVVYAGRTKITRDSFLIYGSNN
jgi:hypothetical protein